MKLHEILKEENVGKKFKEDYCKRIYEVVKDEDGDYSLKNEYTNLVHMIPFYMINVNFEEVTEKDTGWAKEDIKTNEKYWMYDDLGVSKIEEDKSVFDTQMYLRANKFTTQEKCIRKKETLWRKLQRFADENNEEIDWDGGRKYYIYYDHFTETLVVGNISKMQDFGQVYFSSKEIANRAIEEFREELKEYFKN